MRIVLFGSSTLDAASVNLESLEIGSADDRRWRPGVIAHGTADVDGDSFQDAVLTPGSTSEWATWDGPLWARWSTDAWTYLARLEAGQVSVEDVPAPRWSAVVQPNPARGNATIRYALPAAGQVRLGIYDVAGHLVTRLVDGTVGGGVHEVVFRASAMRPTQLYLYRLEWAGRSLEGKFVILR